MDLIERIGAVLGLAAFLGLAVLALLYFQQARDVRRLREWAGKAPERAAAAAEQATFGEQASEEPAATSAGALSRAVGRVRSALSRIGDQIMSAWAAVDRRSPLDLRIVATILVVVGLAAAVFVLHPFGVLDEDGDGDGGSGKPAKVSRPPGQVEVAVLNGSSASLEPIPDLAGQVAPLVEDAGYELGRLGDATTPFEDTVIMYAGGHKVDATALAEELSPALGETSIEPVSDEIRELAAGANLALVVGPDDAQS